MYPSLFSPTLFLPSLLHFLTLLAVVPVRVLFKPVLFQNSFSYFVLRCGSLQTRTHCTGASTVVTFVFSAPSSAMSFTIFLRVGLLLDSTCLSSYNSFKR